MPSDPAQIIIFIVILVLTGLLIILGREAFFVLRELRITLSKANKILDTADELTQNLHNPVSAFSKVFSGVKTGTLIAKIFKRLDT